MGRPTAELDTRGAAVPWKPTPRYQYTLQLKSEAGIAVIEQSAAGRTLAVQPPASSDAIMEMMPMLELGTPDMVSALYSEETGMVEVSWVVAANASGYIIIAINVNDISGDVVAVPLNDGDLEAWSVGGLTTGQTYDVYVAATGSGGRFTLSDAARATVR